jgi:restriction system protein
MKNESGLFEYDDVQPIYNAYQTRILGYEINIQHKGLGAFKRLSSPDLDSLQTKINLLVQNWQEKWEKLEEKRLKQELIVNSHTKADELSNEAEEALEAVNNILVHTLSIDDKIDWEKMKSRNNFKGAHPKKEYEKEKASLEIPKEMDRQEYNPQPEKNSPRYDPRLSIIEKIIPALRQKKLQQVESSYEIDMQRWREECAEIDKTNENNRQNLQAMKAAYEAKLVQLEKDYETELSKWDEEKSKFEADQQLYNAKIDEWKESYFKGEESAIIEYCSQVLNNSEYPDSFPHTFELMYQPNSRILIIEYQLPRLSDIPTLKEVRFIQSKGELKESHIPESQYRALYDKVLYELSLRTLHEIFEADQGNWIDGIAFNGWVNEIDKAKGKRVNNCILSIQVKKDIFLEIDLSQIDPKTCFRGLKGVAASKLNSLTPVQPLLTMVKDDARFIASYNVIDKVDSANNLAAMDWEDFEHLIRELFEKEFSSSGGEVKITQASRDGGVDAVAFDPDPIRGGKIVIQAKRYSNTVGVSAVRDLYGTVMNEGATKGILVTTADYGPDAYEFAKGKPITLLNGSNLLSLLEKHGHHAKIDLQEAKAILKSKEQKF